MGTLRKSSTNLSVSSINRGSEMSVWGVIVVARNDAILLALSRGEKN